MSLELLQHWIDAYGYAALVGSLAFGIVGLPVPDETLLVLTGYLVSKGTLELPAALVAAFIGTGTGITVSYLIGRVGGVALLDRYGPAFHMTPDRIQTVHNWFSRTGKWVLSFGYFIPGIRHLTAIVAGTTDIRYPTFALYAYSGGVVWCLTFILLGDLFGDSWKDILQEEHRVILTILCAVLVVVVVISLLRKKKG